MKAPSSKQVRKRKPPIAEQTQSKNKSSIETPVTKEAFPFDDVRARIAVRAYELYVGRGRRDGYAEEDWLHAEREILNRMV